MAKRSTALIRVRLSLDTVERLDGLATQLRSELGRSVARAALMRALVLTSMDVDACRQAIGEVLSADPVRRGRGKGAEAEAEAEADSEQGGVRAPAGVRVQKKRARSKRTPLPSGPP